MEEISQTVTLLQIIRDVYPVSFITIIHGMFGYAMGIYKYRLEMRFLERQIDRNDRLLERLH